ncbi:uncharacterized protein LOC126897800 isoform X2 [Daktulosphaira vitifoliae]|uniref:uncharacterized protein LOC126897800 isoform X2 n=1 Tax=Daktulosphaira vitifoliae TaxID=58002 RepID=UPI0021AAFC7E|nr:uncharacterized protein LOC126897800 isoform X2 [Daktulosphaira vitifoliae]
MNSLTLCMIVLILAVDLSLATSNNSNITTECANCGQNFSLYKSLCNHIFCYTCSRRYAFCKTCNEDFTVEEVMLSCLKCNMPVNLIMRSDKIYCMSCKNKGLIPQETAASSSGQNNVTSSQNNESGRTNNISFTLDSKGRPFYEFF